MNIKKPVLIVLILSITLSAIFAHGANSCIQLFTDSQTETLSSEQRSNDRLTQERRHSTQSWILQDHYENLKAILRISFLPPANRLLTYVRGSKTELVREHIVQVSGQTKLKIEKIPLDESLEGLVIDAGIESGRRFLDAILNLKSTHDSVVIGTFIFIDVNNLGYVNKNFMNKSKDGDALIRGAAKVFQKMCADQGLLFRMGGDEFGIVMPPMNPYELKKFQDGLIKNLRSEVHRIFVEETKMRAENLRVAKKSFELGQEGQFGQVDQNTLDQEIAAFKKYATYSQEGLSIGAVYLGSGDAQAIQNSAENLATQMKVAVKSALHQDISKYTDQKYDYSGPPRLAYRYEFPLIEYSLFKPVKVLDSSIINYELPVVKSVRGRVVKRFGPISVVNYSSEDGQAETRVEYFSNAGQSIAPNTPAQQIPARLNRTEKVDMHTHSGFIDAKSKEARNLLNFFTNNYNQPRGVIWINLLNLGKLNYFVHKTATGDRMIKRYAELIQSVLRYSDVPFKLQGSEFAILIDQVGQLKLEKIKQRLFELINDDKVVHQIYQEQIDFLQEQLSHADNEEKKVNLRLKIAETVELKNNPKVIVSAKLLEGASGIAFERIIQF